MRRVARALEPVELEASHRVHVAELVDQQDAAAGLRHACDLGDDELGPADVVEHAHAPDEIEVAVREGERRRVPQHERASLGRVLAGSGEELLRGVDTHDLAHERRQGVGERARSAADVERPLVAAERSEQPPEPRLQVVVALGLERASMLDRAGHRTTSLVRLAPGDTRIPHASS